MKKYVLCTQSEQYRDVDLYDALGLYGQDIYTKRMNVWLSKPFIVLATTHSKISKYDI